MSADETTFTPAQLRGVTNTEDTTGTAEPDTDPGDWSEDLDTAIYGEQQWLLPGMGDQAPKCGSWQPRGFCDSGDAHIDIGQHNCGRRSCPRCWSGQWARPRTVSVVQRLGAARYDQHPRAVHGVFSPPEGSVTSIDGFYRARSTAVDKAKKHGIRGGLIVPHGYRVTDETKAAFGDVLERGDWSTDRDGGIWRWVRENDRDWRDQTKWSPHFHVIGLARDVAPGGDDSDGWVFKNVKRGDSHSLKPFTLRGDDGYEDMARVVRYLLSHATFEKDGSRQVVTWFGSVHATNFDPESDLSDGAWSVIQRKAEEIVGGHGDRSDEDGAEDELDDCPVDGCDGNVHPIWYAGQYLDDRGDRLDDAAYNRIHTAFLWATDDLDPPPGLKYPRSEDEARHVLSELL